MLLHWSCGCPDMYHLPHLPLILDPPHPQPEFLLGTAVYLHPWGVCLGLCLWSFCLRTKCFSPVDPPTESQAAVLSRLVSMSIQSSLKIWIVPFPHCSVILVNGQKSPGGKTKSIATVYTRCSILRFFLKRTQHALHLMGCRCENWLRSQNQLRECDFSS